MEETSTERFLRLMNERNNRIAADEVASEQQGVGLDPVRIQTDKQRREKYGQLRARAKPGHRPVKVRSVFPHVDPS